VVLKNSEIHFLAKKASAIWSSLECLFSRRKSTHEVKSDALFQVKQDSEHEFSQLYHVHVQELFNYGMHVCDDPAFVRSCLQKLFVHVWQQPDESGVVSPSKSHLFRSFRKLLIEKILTRKLTVRVTDFSRPQFEFKQLTNDLFSDYGVSPFNNEQIIQGLTRRQAEAVFLKFYNRFSYREVATIMDINLITVYTLVSGVVEILRHQASSKVLT
jgi:DNA-directed RNA polymerase specialized sigma24 family protein